MFLPPQRTLVLEYHDGGDELLITAMRYPGLFISVVCSKASLNNSITSPRRRKSDGVVDLMTSYMLSSPWKTNHERSLVSCPAIKTTKVRREKLKCVQHMQDMRKRKGLKISCSPEKKLRNNTKRKLDRPEQYQDM